MATLKLLNATGITGPTSTSNFTISGLGTAGSPYSGNSTNSGLHNTTANASFTITGSGTGTLEYDVTISSEQNFDLGRILKNGVAQLTVSGPTTTHTGNFSVSAGDSVQVQYSKDGSVNGGLDVFTVNSLFITGSPTARFLGTSTFKFLDSVPQTATPTITDLRCEYFSFGDTYAMSVTVRNNDTTSAILTVSKNSSMSGSSSSGSNIAFNASTTLSTESSLSPFSGTQTAYATATATGKTVSNITAAYTVNVTFCDAV
jgi:hypothetical protein